MGKFADPSYTILKTYFEKILAGRTGTDNSYLIGPESSVASEGGVYTQLYELKPVEGFIGHNFQIVSVTGNNFVFEYSGTLSTASIASSLELDNELYFRKDSYFHEWLRFNSDLYQDDVNTNKTFIYFGRAYPVSGYTDEDNLRINVIFDGLKDFVYAALPVNNRNTNIEEWIEVFWDQSYHSVYNLMKTMWSMIDAKEVNFDFLAYIADAFGVAINEGILTEAELREWVQNIAYFLKRKGTYSSYFIIWKLLLGNVTNNLNIYERWQEWCSAYIQDYPIPWFTDHHYLEYYGIQPSGAAGDYYYSQFAGDYPTHADIAPSATGCVESTWRCTGAKSYQSFDESDVGANIDVYADRVFITTFDGNTDDIYLIASSVVPSGTDFRYCMTTNVSTSATPSSSVMFWALSNEQDSLDSHTGNWIGSEVEVAPTIKFRLYDKYSGSTYTVESTGTYVVDRDYYCTVYKVASAGTLSLDIFDRERRGENDRLETLNMTLKSDESWTYLHGINSVAITAAPSGSFTGEISDLYTSSTTFNDVGLSGYWIQSPHYRIEMDLTGEPLGDTYIISEDLIDEMIRYWEYTKPVNKFVSYNYLIAPNAEMSEAGGGAAVGTYSEDFNGFLNTAFTGSIYSSAASAIGGGGEYVGATYSFSKVVAGTTWRITHNLGTSDVIAQFYNPDRNMLIPQDVTVIDSNTIEAYFNEAVRGTAFVAGADYTHTQTSSANTWSIVHSLGTSGYSNPLVQIWDEDRDNMFASEVDEISTDQFDADFGSYTLSGSPSSFEISAAGYGQVRRGTYGHTQSTPASTWSITHNLNALGLLVEVFSGDILVHPSDITLDTYNRCTITFSELVTGSARLIKFARNLADSEEPLDPTGLGLLSTYGEQGYWEVGDRTNEAGVLLETYNYTTNNRLANTTATGSLTSVETSGSYYYINFTIPEGQELDIKEMGIFNNEGDMMFYSWMSNIHKPSNVSIIVQYKVLQPSS